MVKTLDNSQNVIDSRDVIERIAELESQREDSTLNDDEAGELKALLAVQEEAEGYASDWKYGEALIRESHFTEYAQELADDIGATDRDAKWPNTHIDWEAAANELKQDYTEVDFDGVTYLIRCS